MKDIEFPSQLFISGIDTDAGKSFATGWLANQMQKAGLSVITQKFIQTGNNEFSEDIEIHRKITGSGLLPVDLNHLTAPEIFSYPASPDLAARIDNRELDIDKITRATNQLQQLYDYILIEGAGGLMVPLKKHYLTIDFIKDRKLPVVIVTNGRLGSINHTLLSLNAVKTAGLDLFAVIYNAHFDTDRIICNDTREFIQGWLTRYFPQTHYWEIPSL